MSERLRQWMGGERLTGFVDVAYPIIVGSSLAIIAGCWDQSLLEVHLVTQKFTPREAMSAAKRLGWEVKPKKASGAISFRAPSSETFTCAAPGRADRVPMMLAKALEEAMGADR